MREASYTDAEGKSWWVALPEGIPDNDASMGLPLGPPDLSSLGLPKEMEIKLHNQLFSRRIFTYKEARARRTDIFAALQSAFAFDTEKIVQLYNSDSLTNNSGEDLNGSGPSSSPRTNRRKNVRQR